MNFIHPGLQLVIRGRVPPSLTRLSNSDPSSRMVRSAAKFVSKTRSKPSILTAASIFPVTRVPGGYPNSSPNAARTAGASWATTNLVGSFIASKISSIYSFSVMAPTGQTIEHCPQFVHATSLMSLPKAGSTLASKPLPTV